MKLSDTSIRRPVTTAMVAIGLLVFGMVAVTRMPVDIYPNVTLPMIVVATLYPGAGPLEVESEVTEPIEQNIGTIQNIKTLASRSVENVSVVQLQFDWGTNLDAASSDVRDRLAVAEASLPDDAQKPFVLKLNSSMIPIVQLGMYGDVDAMQMRDIAEDFAQSLQRVAGVASVSVAGGTRRQVQVVVDVRKLAAAGITTDALNQTLAAQNLNYPAGTVTSQGREYLIRLMGQYQDPEAVGNTVIGMKGNAPILLKDIAAISWQPEEETQYARYNGKSSVFVVVQRRPDANTVQVAALVRAEIDRLKKALPAGIDVQIFFDSSTQIKNSVSNVAINILLGGILAVMILFVFLRRFRATMFVAFSIPISIFFAVFFMYIFGFTINILSMAGLAIAVGMVVDNGIVAFESIFRHRERGEESFAAASVGTNEIAMAITASTLTTVVVFLPMLLMRGMLLIFFRELVWAVVGSLTASLAVALTLIPMLSSRYLKMRAPGTQERGLQAWSERMYQGLENTYGRMIGWAVGHRRLVVLVAIVLFVASLGLVPFLGREFMPAEESTYHQLTAEMPVGTSLDSTNAAVSRIEQHIMDKWGDDVEGVSAQVGGGASIYSTIFGGIGTNGAQLNLILKERSQRKHPIDQMDDDIREFAATIPGMKLRVLPARSMANAGGMGNGSDVEIDISGHDLAVADSLTRQVVAALDTISGLTDVRASREPGKPELQLVVDRQKAALYGLTPYQIGSALRTQFQGNAASQFRLAGKEYDILVRLRREQRNSINGILGTSVTGPLGTVPLKSLVTVRSGTSPLEVERENNERIVRVTAKAIGGSSGQLGARAGRAIRSIAVPPDFSIKLAGAYADMMQTFKDLGLVVLIALMLVFMVMASQFESFRDPFIIMFTVPFALIGVLWALFLTKTAISVTSGLGILVLMGIVVNNGIVYIDYVNQLRRNQGMNLIDAVKEGGRVRLRPILMTSLTTIFGLIPLALQIGEGSELWSPLGRAIIGGMLVSTFLPLVFIPVLYIIFENRSERARQRRAAAARAPRDTEVTGQ